MAAPRCSVVVVCLQELQRLLVRYDVGQPALQRVAQLEECRQLGAAQIPDALLVLLEHLHTDPALLAS